MVKANIILVIIFFSLALLQACKKSYDNPNHAVFNSSSSPADWWMGEPPNLATDDTSIIFPHYVKDYTLFQPGTYWVYQDSATGVLDSQWVTKPAYNNIVVFNGSYDQFGRNRYSVIESYVYSSYHKNLYAYLCTGTFSEYPKNSFTHKIIRYVYDSSMTQLQFTYVQDPVYFVLPGIIGRYAYNGNGNTFESSKISDVNFLTQFQLTQLQFNNVVEVLDTKNFIDGNEPTKVYYAQKIGLIKIQHLTSKQTWNLVRYHIVQ